MSLLHLSSHPQCSRDHEQDKSLGRLFILLFGWCPGGVQFLISDEDITQVIVTSGYGDVILDEDDDINKKCDTFKSFNAR